MAGQLTLQLLITDHSVVYFSIQELLKTACRARKLARLGLADDQNVDIAGSVFFPLGEGTVEVRGVYSRNLSQPLGDRGNDTNCPSQDRETSLRSGYSLLRL